MEIKNPIIWLNNGTTIAIKEKRQVNDRTIDILKLHQVINENKKIKIRYASFSDGNLSFNTYNNVYDEDCKDKTASFNINSSLWHLNLIVKPVRLTKKYIVVDPKETKLLIPTEIVRAFTLKRVLEHPRVDWFQGNKQKFYIDYVSDIETV